jgi:hypothetical protein
MMLAAMLAMVLAAAAPALAQEDSGGDSVNAAGVNCTQIIQQIGGDQYAGATGSGEGDTAAVNNQQFTAQQIQQCLAIAGNNNTGGQNVGGDTDVPAPSAPSPGDGGNGGSSNGGGGGASGGSGSGVAVLPDTGGLPVPTLLAGVALISCGLLARRLVR